MLGSQRTVSSKVNNSTVSAAILSVIIISVFYIVYPLSKQLQGPGGNRDECLTTMKLYFKSFPPALSRGL